MSVVLHNIVAGIVRITEWLAAVGIIICVGLNLTQVISRYFLYAPLPWSEEVMRYAMIWVAMLGATAALGRAELPAVNLFATSRSVLLKRLAAITAAVSVCIFCVTLIVTGWPTLRRALKAVSPGAEIPLHYPYLALFIGSALLTIVAVATIFLKQPIEGGQNDG